MYCINCGEGIAPDARFCARCGAPAAVSVQPWPAPVAAVPQGAQRWPAPDVAATAAAGRSQLKPWLVALAVICALGAAALVAAQGWSGAPTGNGPASTAGSSSDSGASSRGAVARLKMDLRDAAIAEETYFMDHNEYAQDVTNLDFTRNDAVGEISVVSADVAAYCLRGTASDVRIPYYYDSASPDGLTQTPCG